MSIKSQDLLDAGFIRVVKKYAGTGESYESDEYILPDWDPTPRVSLEGQEKAEEAGLVFTPTLFYGSQQKFLRTKEDVVRAVNKSIPVFCERA